MYIQLFIDLAFLIFVVYGFGTLAASVFCKSLTRAICYAPLLSLGGIYVISVFRKALNMPASWRGIVIPYCVISTVVFVLSVLFNKRNQSRRRELTTHNFGEIENLVIYIFLGVLVATFVYILPLDSSSSFFQGYDSYYHISTVRDYLNTGYYCYFPILGYPNLWHCIAAIVASFGNLELTVAVNAFNYFLISFVVPSSMFLLVDSVFCDNEKAVLFGAFVSQACAAFPWNYVCNGPLYALLMGWSVLPIAMAIFVEFWKMKTLAGRFVRLIEFLFSCCVLAVAHPSTIFAGVVLLIPYACFSIYTQMRAYGRSQFASVICSVLMLVVGACFWIYCFNSPMFSSTVSFTWSASSSVPQACADVILGSLAPFYSPQPVLMILVFVGIVAAIRRPGLRWLVVSLLFSCFMYVIAAGTDGYWKHLLTGFWYTDHVRIAGIVGFMFVLVGTLGLSAIIKAAGCLAKRLDLKFSKPKQVICCLGVALLLLAFSLLPNFHCSNGETYVTPFGFICDKLSQYNDMSATAFCYDSTEMSFASKAKEIVGDSKVLNYPYDGSCFAFAINNVNVVNHEWWVIDTDESHPDALIRMKVNEVASNQAVKDACIDEGIQYVMVLDYGHSFGDGVFNYEHRVNEAWAGITSITDSTPGFELILSEGDMRLYRIIE